MQYRNPIFDSIIRLTDAEVRELVVGIKQRQCSACADKLKANFSKLALYLATKTYNRYPHMDEAELKSVALEIVVKRVEQIKNGTALTRDNNISPYMNSSIKHKLLQYCTRETVKRQAEEEVAKYIWPGEQISNEAEYNLMLEDLLTSDSFTLKEREILKLRIEGHTLEVIGTKFGITPQRVKALIHKMRAEIERIIK